MNFPYVPVYICHPYSSDPEGNIAKVKKIVEDIGKNTLEYMSEWSKALKQSGSCSASCYVLPKFTVPVAAFLALPASMSEGSVTRAEAMHFCKGLLSGCKEIWVYSRTITDGMKEEIDLAIELGIKVVWKV